MTKNIISWIGTVTSIIGAFLMAFGIVKYGYIFFCIGSASWLFIGFVTKDRALLTLNATFFVANIIGLYRAFV